MKQKPNSYNSNHGLKKSKYNISIKKAFDLFYNSHSIIKGDLYGTIYYFYKALKKGVELDADNISKPIWDGLGQFLFFDDNQVKLRIAGCIDISTDTFEIFDFTGLSGKVLTELLEAFDTEDHILYIECGKLEKTMFKFNSNK